MLGFVLFQEDFNSAVDLAQENVVLYRESVVYWYSI